MSSPRVGTSFCSRRARLPVPSLELPSGGEVDVRELSRLEAVQLFVERAWLTVPSFKLNSKTAPPVAEICHRLDGIPLALELAAARLAHFSVSELADDSATRSPCSTAAPRAAGSAANAGGHSDWSYGC